jgi:hypothetical protein
MVKHIVAWKLADHAEGNSREVNAGLVKEKLEALRGRVHGLLALEVGIDFSRTPNSADIVLYSGFTDRTALDAYQVHPLHEAAKQFVGKVVHERRLADYVA